MTNGIKKTQVNLTIYGFHYFCKYWKQKTGQNLPYYLAKGNTFDVYTIKTSWALLGTYHEKR